jgi:putative FmdB family regulatory protein
MPIYEYQCSNCGHGLEVLQKISDQPLSECPQCQQTELRKLVSASSFRLKGGGWYETDFKKSNQKQLADSSEKESTPSSSDSSKSDKPNGADAAASSKPDAAKAGSAETAKTASSESATSGKTTKSSPATVNKD